MEIRAVTEDDGRHMANLINFLKAGKWSLSGTDIAAFGGVYQWVQRLAVDMASQLSPPPSAPPPATPDDSFEIKKITRAPKTSKEK